MEEDCLIITFECLSTCQGEILTHLLQEAAVYKDRIGCDAVTSKLETSMAGQIEHFFLMQSLLQIHRLPKAADFQVIRVVFYL